MILILLGTTPQSEQVLKDSVGLFKAHENKTDEKKGDDKVFDETKVCFLHLVFSI